MGLDEKKAVTSSEARGLFINMLRCLASLDMTYMTFWTALVRVGLNKSRKSKIKKHG